VHDPQLAAAAALRGAVSGLAFARDRLTLAVVSAIPSSDETAVPEPGSDEQGTPEPTHDENGVDLTLIDELLRMEPGERLLLNDRAVNAVLELRDAFAAKP
jgi:hypothetical protein